MMIKAFLCASFLFTLSLAQTQGDNQTPTLDPAAIQSGSFTDGTTSIGSDAGQSASLTSKNNFINFCKGQALTNGLQITTGSCNGIGVSSCLGALESGERDANCSFLFSSDGPDPFQG